MSDDVVITMTAQDAQMVASWQKSRASIQAHEDALGKLGRKSKQVSEEGTSSLEDWAQGVSVTALAVGGMTKAYQLLEAQLEKVHRLESRAASSQVGIESARRRAMSVAGDLNKDDLSRSLIEGANGVAAQDMFLAFEAATSAAGAGVSRAATRDAVLESAVLRPDLELGARTSLITGALQLQKAFGGDIPTAMAAVQQSFGTSRSENLGAFSKSVVPTVSDLAAQGGGKDSFKDLMGLAVGFGQRTNDPTGDRTRTALASIAKQARETAITKGLVGKDASVLQSIEAIRNNPKAQAELLGVFAQQTTGKSAAQLKRDSKKGTLTAEAANFQAAVELFQGGDNATTRAIKGATESNLGMTPQALADIQKQQQEVSKSSLNLAARMDRQLQQVTAETDLLNPGRAARAKAREFVEKSREVVLPGDFESEMGAGFVAKKIRDTVDAFRGDEGYIASQKQLLERRAEQLRQDATPQSKEFAGKLDEMVATLAEVLDELRNQGARPQKVEITNDKRAVAPRRAPIGGAADAR